MKILINISEICLFQVNGETLLQLRRHKKLLMSELKFGPHLNTMMTNKFMEPDKSISVGTTKIITIRYYP